MESSQFDEQTLQKVHFAQIYRPSAESWVYWGGFAFDGISPERLRSQATGGEILEQVDIWFSLDRIHFGNARFVVPNCFKSMKIDQRDPSP